MSDWNFETGLYIYIYIYIILVKDENIVDSSSVPLPHYYSPIHFICKTKSKVNDDAKLGSPKRAEFNFPF